MSKTVFDQSKLRGKIVEKCGSIDQFAAKLSITPTTAGRKLSGKSEWTQDQMIKACAVLDIPTTDIPAYFFARQV